MDKFKADRAYHKKESGLKKKFMEESGWKAKKDLADLISFLLLMAPSFVVSGWGLFSVGNDQSIFARHLIPIFVTALISMALFSITGRLFENNLDKKSEKAYREWKLASGN